VASTKAQNTKIQQTIVDILSSFVQVSGSKLDTAISDNLRRIGEFIGIDRSYVFLYGEDPATLTNTHEWCAKGIQGQKSSLEHTKRGLFSYALTFINRGKPFTCDDITTLPKAASKEKVEYVREGIQSMALFPISVGNNIIGFAGYDAVKHKKSWSTDDILLLEALARILGQVFERKKAEKEIESQVRLQSFMSNISSRFVHVQHKDIVNVINLSIEEAGQIFNVDRCYVFELDNGDGSHMSNTFEWCNTGVIPEIKNLQHLSLKQFALVRKTIMKGSPLILDNVDTMPKINSNERAEFKRQGIQSIAMFPMITSSNVIGFIGFDAVKHQRVWKPNDILLLNFLAENIGHLLERRKTEQTVRVQTSALQAADNGVVITDIHGIIQWVNPAVTRITGYDKQELIGRPTSIFHSGQHSAQFYSQLWKTIKDAKVWHGEITNRRKDGSFYVEEQTIAPVIDSHGKIKHFVGVKQDVTQRKKTEIALKTQETQLKKAYLEQKKMITKLENADRIKTQFLSITSHELRTPITPIQGQLELLLQGIFGSLNEKQKQSIEMILRNTKRLDLLIGDILDVSKLKSGNMKFIMEKADLNLVVKQAVEMMAIKAKEKNIKLMSKSDSKLKPFIFDANRMTQVITNLIGNAIKFTPSKGLITIEVNQENEYAMVTVADTGIGIKKSDWEKIFLPFMQADSTVSRKFGGSGLGLAISLGIARAHGGDISLKSQVGKGTTFIVKIPLKCNTKDENLIDNQ